MAKKVIYGPSLLTDQDIYLFKEGRHFNLYEKLGSHIVKMDGKQGVFFALWAPNAKSISVVGDFNKWDIKAHPLTCRWDGSGIFEGFIPELENGTVYKYYIVSKYNNRKFYKIDPFAFLDSQHPTLVSIVWDLKYQWNDQEWMKRRKKYTDFKAPYSIYEMHLGSWKKKNANSALSYREMGDQLVDYIKDLGFTFVEFLPVMEHPFYGSWGYQISGYFAPTSRYGPPEDFMYLIDRLHKNGIGVILDWVPSHFPSDPHSLVNFDGTNLYEHADPRKGFHPDWNSLIFNYGRTEVKEFLINSALFWLDKYHIDGIRVDAVASMLYLDYSRKEGEWLPNHKGGRENLEAIDFLQSLNKIIYQKYPDVHSFAEESTAWPLVTRPVDIGGLGFGMKWNMGWMHDVLNYFALDPVHRKYHQEKITFSLIYAFNENFILPLSHDEVVHGKGSLLSRMPGDNWQKHANLRLLYGYLYAHPGKKLLFMGNEFAMQAEWQHDFALNWDKWNDFQKATYRWIKALNTLYNSEPALYENDFQYDGFEWLDNSDYEKSIICFVRKDLKNKNMVAVFCNFTPVPRENYRIGMARAGKWKKILNSDDKEYFGSGYPLPSEINTKKIKSHGREQSSEITLPPLAIVMYKHEG